VSFLRAELSSVVPSAAPCRPPPAQVYPEGDDDAAGSACVVRWPLLVCCPTSLIENWEREFDMWGCFKVGGAARRCAWPGLRPNWASPMHCSSTLSAQLVCRHLFPAPPPVIASLRHCCATLMLPMPSRLRTLCGRWASATASTAAVCCPWQLPGSWRWSSHPTTCCASTTRSCARWVPRRGGGRWSCARWAGRGG